MLPIINQRILNRLIIDISINNCPSPNYKACLLRNSILFNLHLGALLELEFEFTQTIIQQYSLKLYILVCYYTVRTAIAHMHVMLNTGAAY